MENTMCIIEEEVSVTIKSNIETVFPFFSDLRNDKLWRKEINSTTIDGNVGIYVIAVEDSRLSKKVPHYISKLECIEYLKNERIVYQTIPNYYFLKSIREVHYLNAFETEIAYKIEFDKAVVKHGLGFNLPSAIVKYVTRVAMRKYLRKLKHLVENNQSYLNLPAHNSQ